MWELRDGGAKLSCWVVDLLLGEVFRPHIDAADHFPSKPKVYLTTPLCGRESAWVLTICSHYAAELVGSFFALFQPNEASHMGKPVIQSGNYHIVYAYVEMTRPTYNPLV